MIAEVEAGNVSTIIVKDMSRFGRDYLKVGFYTDVMFRDRGIRFIAVNNGIDNDKQGDNDFTPFLDIMKEFYARDSSRRIQAIFKSRMEKELRCSGSVPYGYRRDPEDKQHLIVDEEAAAVVRRIFQMVIEGKGVQAIVRTLTEDKILIPAAYAQQHYPENHHSHGYYHPCLWSSTAVSYILEKQEYMGHTVLGKTICENYKTKKRRKAKPEELVIFRVTHEAVLDEETWQLAHCLKRTIRKPSYPDCPSNPLTGLLYCSDCGCKMTHRQPSPAKKKVFDADSAPRGERLCPGGRERVYPYRAGRRQRGAGADRQGAEEAKAQKALAARNREREQNRLRRVREAQRAAKVAGKVSLPVG